MRKFTLLRHDETNGSYLEILSTKSRYIHLANTWDFMCGLTQGYIAGHGAHQDWMWKVPFSAQKNEDGLYAKTMGSQLYELESYALSRMLENPISLDRIQISESLYDNLSSDDRDGKLFPKFEKILNSKNGIELARIFIQNLEAETDKSSKSKK